MNGWISVDDELPPPTGVMDAGTDQVLVWVSKDYAPHVYTASGDWCEGFDWYVEGLSQRRPFDSFKVTHWQPTPGNPK